MAHKHVWFDVTTVSDAGEVRKCFACGIEQIRLLGSDKWKARDLKVLPLATYARE